VHKDKKITIFHPYGLSIVNNQYPTINTKEMKHYTELMHNTSDSRALVTLEGREEGEKQAKIAVAKNPLKAGVSVDLIAESTGLSQTEISQLKEIA
jgi:predicted transposase/invertase (TIGR01784 family)